MISLLIFQVPEKSAGMFRPKLKYTYSPAPVPPVGLFAAAKIFCFLFTIPGLSCFNSFYKNPVFLKKKN